MADADASIPPQSEHVNTRNFDSAHLSNIGAIKPSPAKAKPAVSAKPEKPKKPSLIEDQTSVKAEIKQCEEHISTEHLMPSKPKKNLSSDAAHFQQDVISSSHTATEFAHTVDLRVGEETQSNEKASHHYELYDVTARGLSGTPREVELDSSTASEDKAISHIPEAGHGRCQTLPLAATRMVEVAEEHVAMPYNVVDVTVPRQLNSADVQWATMPTNTWPHRPQPAKRHAIPKPQERVTKCKEQTPSNINVSGHQQPHGCAATVSDSKMVQSDLVSDRYAYRIYEDIDDLDVDRFSSKTTARSSVSKSPAFEARVAALASLDFKKTGKQASTVAPAVTPPEQSISVKSDVVFPAQDSIVVPATKQEKTRKSGGKMFFQKFLKFRSKDTSEAAQSTAIGSSESPSDEASLKVVECPGSPSQGKTSVSDDGISSPEIVLPQAASLNEKQAMLINLKDCLAKRQTSVSNDSVKNSVVHSRTRSSGPLRSSIQSVSSVQEAHGNNVEKNEKHIVVLQETLPSADSRFASLASTEQQPVSISVSDSVTTHARELSEIDKSPQTVDKKLNEMQRLEVRDLTVVTEDAANVDCSMSTCSSDAVSPTPSDLSVEGSDHHSLKRKSRTDRQGRRRMLEAPPPPPSAAAAVLSTAEADNAGVLTCPRLMSAATEAVGQHPTSFVRHLSVPCDGPSSSIEVPLSRSLPRPSSKTPVLSDKKLSADDILPVPSTAEQTAQQACSKATDVEQWNEGVADNKTDEERLSELSEKRTSRFFNRALPDPPSAQTSQTSSSATSGVCPEELNNLYDLISQSTAEDESATPTEVLNAGEMYEDIDDCLERSDPAPTSANDSLSSHRSSTSRSSSIQHATQNPQDDEYLEPVIPPEEEIQQSSNWRPSPAPRLSLSVAADTQHMSYVNAEMMSTAVPTLRDGFTTVTEICRDALKQVAERMTAQYVTASWPTSVHLEWSNFELYNDGEPSPIQQHICYYCARHATLAPKGCVLMVFKIWPQRSLTAHQHPNVMSPLTTFCTPQLSTGTCTNVDNVAVLPSTRVINFCQYWQDQHTSSSSNSECLERKACLTLARLLSAALYLHEHSLEIPRLLPRRVVMTVLDTGECYPQLRPSARVSNSSDASGMIANDISELISIMLQIDSLVNVPRPKSNSSVKREKPIVTDVEASISPQSSYSRCLQRVLRCLHQKTGNTWVEGVKEAQQLLDFTLWGPSEDEARMIAISDGRDTALQVWLSVSICRLLAELVVAEGISLCGLEVAERATFLSSSTTNGLLEITKLLFT